MAKKQKTRKVKSIKNRTNKSIIIAFFLIISRLFFWIIKQIYFLIQKNALLVVGFLIFIISFGFISLNALFFQIKTYQSIFSNITPALSIEKNSKSSKKEATFHTDIHTISLSSLNDLHTNSSAKSLPKNMLKMQKKLAKLGFYDGPLDGIDGPKTQRAIASWKQQTAHKRKNTILPNPATDEIAILIKHSKMESAKELSSSKADIVKSSPPPADIAQVQKALRAFGHQEVIVTGVEDQKTVDALKQFQKMFKLPITGKIDKTVLKKMREIHLLN
ncbi:peptidoglycan-binding domain-containing protein [Bartonella sp. B30(2025)]